MEHERCCLCDSPTGRAGRSDDSLYIETPESECGPLCEPCWGALRRDDLEAELAQLREDKERVGLRFGCIARVSAQHENHACPQDDCLECYPGDIVEELQAFAARSQDEEDGPCRACGGAGCVRCDARSQDTEGGA